MAENTDIEQNFEQPAGDAPELGSARNWDTSINVGGMSLATSLFWQPLQNTETPFAEVEEAASVLLEGADLFCIKPGKSPQFGICVAADGYKLGENVAAVALSTALSETSSFVAVFKVDNGWWYTCIRNDIILSDGDMLFTNEEDAKNQFLSMLAVPDWGKKIAPKEWGIEETVDVELEPLLLRGTKTKLQKIKALRGTKLMVAIISAIVLGLWAVSSIIDYLLTPAQKVVIQPIAPKIAKKVQPTVVAAPQPWTHIKNPDQVADECQKNIVKLVEIMPPGWKISTVSCKNNMVETSWAKEVGRISVAEQAMKKSGIKFASMTFSGDGRLLSAKVELPKIKTINSMPKKLSADMQNEINDLFQSLGQPISLSAQSTGGDDAKKNKGQNFKFLRYRFTSTHNPGVWKQILNTIPGLSITSIIYSPHSGVWEYEGDIYVL